MLKVIIRVSPILMRVRFFYLNLQKHYFYSLFTFFTVYLSFLLSGSRAYSSITDFDVVIKVDIVLGMCEDIIFQFRYTEKSAGSH